MKLVGLMPVRNEEWCLGMSARVALQWCDELVMLFHCCTDRSNQIGWDLASECPDRTSQIFTAGGWNEMEHRQWLLSVARERKATHLAIIDADEILTGNLLEQIGGQTLIRSLVEATPQNHIMQLPGYNLRGGLHRYHSSGIWANRWFSTAFIDDPALSWSGDKFHLREPQGRKLWSYKPVAQGGGGVMHLWGASERRLRAKSALYKITERIRWPNKRVEEIDTMYSWAIYGRPEVPADTVGAWIYADVPGHWWARYSETKWGQYLDVNAEPWQEAECVRLVKEYGPRMCEDLDLFGVC